MNVSRLIKFVCGYLEQFPTAACVSKRNSLIGMPSSGERNNRANSDDVDYLFDA
jgi:hypothetical protein